MVRLAIEGEPGIGKTRFLFSVAASGRTKGFLPVSVTPDEEIPGPFLVARSIFGSFDLAETAWNPGARQALERGDASEAMDDSAWPSMPAERRLPRAYDLAALALRAMSWNARWP